MFVSTQSTADVTSKGTSVFCSGLHEVTDKEEADSGDWQVLEEHNRLGTGACDLLAGIHKGCPSLMLRRVTHSPDFDLKMGLPVLAL